jgi:hypothetical protein
VNMPVGGKLLLSTNAQVNFTAGSSLTVGGQLEIQSGARLRLDGSDPVRDLTLLSGSELTGTGGIRFEGGNRLLLLADVSSGISMDFSGVSIIAGANLLTVATGTLLRFDHTTIIPGSVTVEGTLAVIGSPVTLSISGTLTLAGTGSINNSDTIRVGVFVNLGGAITGNAPVVVGPAIQPLRIDHIQLTRPITSGATPAPTIKSPETITLTWMAKPGSHFIIETSTGLKRWAEQPATVLETSPGVFHATFLLGGSKMDFYRLRVVPIASSTAPARE